MSSAVKTTVSPVLVIVAFATVYIVWGSTYFFIKVAITDIPPLMLGALRFLVAGCLMLTWCIMKGEKIFAARNLMTSAISGVLLLAGGNGSVIWEEQTLPSALVAIIISAAPIWFVIIDKPNWRVNFTSRSTLTGLFIGFAGVMLLFSEQIKTAINNTSDTTRLLAMGVIVIGSICWVAGSIYSKYNSTTGSGAVNIAWQMIFGGLVFLSCSIPHGDFSAIHWRNVGLHSWLALAFLVFLGSIAAFSAYVWLLQVKSATQVSTYAYVNPVIAVLLGVMFAHEQVSILQISGLIVILGSVLLINLAKYRSVQRLKKEKDCMANTHD